VAVEHVIERASSIFSTSKPTLSVSPSAGRPSSKTPFLRTVTGREEPV
jgi:hypothetical protein